MAPKSELKKALRLAEKQVDEHNKALEAVLGYVQILEGRKTVTPKKATPYWEPVYEDFVDASARKSDKIAAIRAATEAARAKEAVDKIRSGLVPLTFERVIELATAYVAANLDDAPDENPSRWLQSKMYGELRKSGYPPAKVRRVIYPGDRTSPGRKLLRSFEEIINKARSDREAKVMKNWGEEMRKAVSLLRQNKGGKITLDGNGLPTYTGPPPEIPQDILKDLFRPIGKVNRPSDPIFDNLRGDLYDSQKAWG